MLISFFPQPSVPLPNRLMMKVATLAGLEVVHELVSNMDFCSQRPIWLRPLLSAQPDSNRNQYWVHNMSPFPRDISQPFGIRLITLDYFHPGRNSTFFSVEHTNILDMNLSSLPVMILPKPTTRRFPKCLIRCYSFSYSITFYFGNYSISNSPSCN